MWFKSRDFQRDADETIIFEGAGLFVRTLSPKWWELLTSGHLQYCKFFVTSKRVVGAEARNWSRHPLAWPLMLVAFRTLIFEVAIEDVHACIFWQPGGRYFFVDGVGHTRVIVTHSLRRADEASEVFAALRAGNPNVRCIRFNEKKWPADLNQVLRGSS
jgi:hypothetical protein